MSLSLRKIAETTATITLEWTPTGEEGGYVLYANGRVVAVATKNLKDGSPRSSTKFSKTTPGPPYEVTAVRRGSSGIFSLAVGKYPPPAIDAIYPSTSLYPSEG